MSWWSRIHLQTDYPFYNHRVWTRFLKCCLRITIGRWDISRISLKVRNVSLNKEWKIVYTQLILVSSTSDSSFSNRSRTSPNSGLSLFHLLYRWRQILHTFVSHDRCSIVRIDINIRKQGDTNDRTALDRSKRDPHGQQRSDISPQSSRKIK